MNFDFQSLVGFGSPGQHLAVRRLHSCKIFSVDGCHTTQHTLADIHFGSQVFANGGLLVIDDFGKPGWGGVVDGTSLYFGTRNVRLAPLMIGFNKLVCTTISHHHIYHKALTDWGSQGVAGRHYDHQKELQMYGWPVVHLNAFKGL